ncbi:MAG TPA: helix-turn-helix domain-containing protein, partial [Thermoanaerobaculia bacterium]|nr:helix-turn-helix domain-containing protein [Thermoanaerobaculia bacterium]
LRARPDDLPLLTAEFLAELAGGGVPLRIDPAALAVLRGCAWPGNVRELRNALQRAAVVAEGGVVRIQDLPPRLLTAAGVDVTSFGPELALSPAWDDAVPLSSASSPVNGRAEPTVVAGDGPSRRPDPGEPLPLAELERRAILAAWDRAAGNRLEMARQLGIGRTTLYRKLKEMGLG